MKWDREEQIVICYIVESISFVRQFVVLLNFVLKNVVVKIIF